MRVCTFMMRNLSKCDTFLLVVCLVAVTQATIVQNDIEVNRESYFQKIKIGRQIIGVAGEEVKVWSNRECSHGYNYNTTADKCSMEK